MNKCKICEKNTLPGEEYCIQCSPNKSKQERNMGQYQQTKGGGDKYQSSKIPDHCIFDTFYNEKGYIKSDIFLTSGQDAARSIYNSKMKKTQVRDFLRYLRGIEIPLKLPNKPGFDSIIPQIDELSSFARYQANRDKPPYTKTFKYLFDSHLKVIKRNEKEFIAFVKYISAIIAYLTELEKTSKRRKQNRS